MPSSYGLIVRGTSGRTIRKERSRTAARPSAGARPGVNSIRAGLPALTISVRPRDRVWTITPYGSPGAGWGSFSEEAGQEASEGSGAFGVGSARSKAGLSLTLLVPTPNAQRRT